MERASPSRRCVSSSRGRLFTCTVGGTAVAAAYRPRRTRPPGPAAYDRLVSVIHRLRATLRGNPLAADALLAGALFLLVVLVPDPDQQGPSAPLPLPVVGLVALSCAVLALRRRSPLPVLAATTAGAALVTFLDGGRTLAELLALPALYTVAVRSNRRTTWIAWAATAGTLTLANLVVASILDPDALSNLTWAGAAAALGDALRNRRAYVAAVEERAVRAERTRDEEARRRVAEERLHIARELHDVVAHRIAVVQVQAGVASHLLTSQPDAAREALGHVRRASSEILDELSGILNVLREPGEAPHPTAPAPGLAQVEALVASFAAAGLAVDWSVTGRPRSVGAAVDLVAYRVLEEALTNAHKHGTGTARVAIEYRDRSLALCITNPVRAADHQRPLPSGGHGLLGMRERAAAVGGVLQASPRPDGQFHVEAALPLHASAAA